jgi:hypothetical protein
MEPSDELRAGRRHLSSIKGYELLDDFVWEPNAGRWVIHFRLNGTASSTIHVPQTTSWFCFISPQYPYGSIEIYPDKSEGITATFPHMSYKPRAA